MSRTPEEWVSDLRVDIARLQSGYCYLRNQINAHGAQLTDLGSRANHTERAVQALQSSREKSVPPSEEKPPLPWADITKVCLGLMLALAVILSKAFPQYAALLERVLR